MSEYSAFEAFSGKADVMMAKGVWVVLGPETILTPSSRNFDSGSKSSEPLLEKYLMKYSFCHKTWNESKVFQNQI